MRHRTHFLVATSGEFGGRVTPGSRRHFVSPIISAIGIDAGSTLASIAAPAITGAAIGAGTAALTHGNIGEGALLGGVGGGALGYMTDASGTPTGTGLYNDASGALDSLFSGSGSALTAGNGSANAGDTGWVPVTDSGGAPSTGSDTGWFSPTDANSGSTPTSTTGQSANVAGTGGGLFGGKPGGISGTSLALGLLSAAGSAMNKPQVGTWQTPTPASTSANAGPYFNQPLNTNVPGRTAVTPPANTDWYTYGQRPEQSFFSGNSLNSYGWKHGGATDRVFDTGNGERFVRGPGTGTSDSVPARLSNGEYVLTASDVSRLGGGSNERGAAILDHDRGALAHMLGERKFTRTPLKGSAGRQPRRAA